MIANQSKSSNWYIKYLDAFFTSIAAGYMLHSLAMFLPEKTTALYPLFLRVSYKYLLAPAVMGIVYVIIANKKERDGKFNSERAHAILFGLIRFWLAAGISSYGFAKILGTQFSGANEIILRDSLLGDISGNYLTWYYFNFSHTYILIIGYLQIGGALLLLFRRSTLLGIFLLLPVLVNIVMIDLFYGIPSAPTTISVVFTAALIYLLLLHTQKLINLFFKTVYALPKAGNRRIKYVLRIAVVVFAFMSIYQYQLKYKNISKPGDSEILGKWKVEQSSLNGEDIPLNTWQTDSSIWTTIYFFDARYCAIGSNPYYFDRTKQNFGEYSFDKSKHLLNIYFLKTKDSLHASINFLAGNKIIVKGVLGGDTINLHLSKVKM
ncbi:MAG: hypothetical protein ACXVNN_09555 [Bacteroidia bacterium]